jgi:hypothetical protein
MGAEHGQDLDSRRPVGARALRSATVAGLVAFVAAIGGSAGLSAQPTSGSTGPSGGQDALWWSVGAGGGSVRLTCDICAADRDAGVTLHLGLGARARENLDIGLELGAWTRKDGNVRETARRIDLRAILRPWAESGFHVIGGLGWIGYSADELGYDSVALSAGAGWDFPLSGRWRIGNRLLLDAASYGSFSNDQGVAASEVSLSIARLEVVLVRR